MKMLYKCLDCGHIFDEPRFVQESRGEFWGAPCYETMVYCPVCGGDFVDNDDDDEEEEEA